MIAVSAVCVFASCEDVDEPEAVVADGPGERWDREDGSAPAGEAHIAVRVVFAVS